MDDDVSTKELLRRYANGERHFAGIYLVDGSELNGAKLEGTTFEDGFFSDIDARYANLRGTKFKNMNLKCTDFRCSDLTDAVFDNVSIEHAAFKGAIVENAVFSKMTFHGGVLNKFRPDEWDWEDSPVDAPT